jgi:hypothetical protein
VNTTTVVLFHDKTTQHKQRHCSMTMIRPSSIIVPHMRFLHIAAAIIAVTTTGHECCHSLSLSSFSHFHGVKLINNNHNPTTQHRYHGASDGMTMRKQKASDRRTRRMQRGSEELAQELIRDNILRDSLTSNSSPLASRGAWNQKRGGGMSIPPPQTMAAAMKDKTGGRGRSRKRSILYTSLSSYHNKFLQLLTAEYLAEVRKGGCACLCVWFAQCQISALCGFHI